VKNVILGGSWITSKAVRKAEEVGFIGESVFFSSWSSALENMFTHSNGRNRFNTRDGDPAAQRPHEPPDEGSRSSTRETKKSLGIFE